MAHPMMGYIHRNPAQLGGKDIFKELLDNLKQSAQAGLTKLQQEAIAKTFRTLASDPTVQKAVVESGKDAAIQSLAAELKAAQATTVNYVRQNPWTTAMIVGGLGVGAILLVMAIRK